MTTRCSIELYDKPVSTSLEDLDGSPLDIFYALGIVNPFGPTLTFVAAAGNPSPGTALPLVKVMLNPFSQTVEQVGRFKVGDTWNPMRDLEPLVELDYGSCPTLLFITNRVDAETRGQLAAKLLSSFGDEAVQVWDSVERHYPQKWLSFRSAPTTLRRAAQGHTAVGRLTVAGTDLRTRVVVNDSFKVFATLMCCLRLYLVGTAGREERARHSTVTLFARFLGLSTSVPLAQAVWYASSCSGTTCRMGDRAP
jgi:hypothetical protein